MRLFARLLFLISFAALLSQARVAWAGVTVDVKQDATTRLWRYAYTVQHDDAIRAMGPGDIEEIALTTRDLLGVDVPFMALLPEGWSINWDRDEDGHPFAVWGNYDEAFELKPGGPAVTFVLFSLRSPAAAILTLADEADHEAEFTVRGPMGE
jgi:hypothetical protein